ncbi:MAG: hypothetical protein ABFC98_05090 [Candidatus Cloacimonas sp.]
MFKFLKLMGVLTLLFFLGACQEKSLLSPLAESFDPLSIQEDKIPLADGEYLYQQNIVISNTENNDFFAYKLITYQGELPEGYFADSEGWLFFQTTGTDNSIPLSEPGNHRTIWTQQRNLQFDFPSSEGKINNLIVQVQVQVKKDSGSIEELQTSLKSNRLLGSQITVPFPDGSITGAGIEFSLQESISDVFVEGLYADHYCFRINKLDNNLQIIESGIWYNSVTFPDFRKVILNANSEPALTADTNTYTQFESYVVSRQGIEEANHHTVYFRVNSGYRPVALICPNAVVGLGTYHYNVCPKDLLIPSDIIESNVPNHLNRRLWQTDNGFEAINSADFKLQLRWAHKGLYCYIPENTVYYTDYSFPSPTIKECNDCLNADSYNYGSRVAYYDLSWDNNSFPPAYQFLHSEVVTHDGQNWLRIRNLDDNSRHYTFQGLASGLHTFKVCAVDLQGAISDPAVISILLSDYKPAASRSGILIVDDSINNVSISPEIYVNNFYNAVVPNTFGPVQVFDGLAEDTANYISATLLQNYKAVLWHSDNYSWNSKLNFNSDALYIYLQNGGNLIISGTGKLNTAFNYFLENGSMLTEKLGLNSITNYANSGNDWFFINALSLNGMNNIALNLTNPFNNTVQSRQGLGKVLYFEPSNSVDFLYQFGCKPVNSEVYLPTQEQFNFYSSKFVGYSYNSGTGKVAVFGFPLSYMNQTETAIALQNLFSNMINNEPL